MTEGNHETPQSVEPLADLERNYPLWTMYLLLANASSCPSHIHSLFWELTVLSEAAGIRVVL